MKLWKALLLALSVLLIILTASHMTGCLGQASASDKIDSRFYKVDSEYSGSPDGYFYEIVDTTTGVHYLVFHQYGGGGLAPMYNSDGSIKVEEVQDGN